MEQTYVSTMLTTEAKINGKLRAILKLEPVHSYFHRDIIKYTLLRSKC